MTKGWQRWVKPPLQLGEGHAFVVSLNGRQVAQRYTATEFMIPPEFWGGEAPPPNQFMQLDASIVDRQGHLLKQAPPVRFQGRYVTLLNRPHPLAPPIQPYYPYYPQQVAPPVQPHRPQLEHKPPRRPKLENETGTTAPLGQKAPKRP